MNRLTTVVLLVATLNLANGYILLTANLEDVQTIAKQLAASPVADQLQKIWRRASTQFNQQVAHARPQRIQKRAQAEAEEEAVQSDGLESPKLEEAEPMSDRDNQVQRRSQLNEDIVALGKNASIYLKSIRKIFEKV